MFSNIFTYIYILPYHQLFSICLCGLLLFLELQQRFDGRWWWRGMIGTALVLWAAVVVYYTVLARSSRTGYELEWIPLRSYRQMLLGGNPELLRTNLMNVVLFIPGGLLWAALSRQYHRGLNHMLCILWVFGLFSLSIEGCQYFFQLGNAECDDVIHNTLGAIVGYFAYQKNWEEHRQGG